MNLQNVLTKNQDKMAEAWLQKLLDVYQPEGAKFFSGIKSQFANPAGHAFRENTCNIIASILQNDSFDKIKHFIDALVRVRAVQGMSASKTMSFFLDLQLIMENFSAGLWSNPESNKIRQDLISRINQVTLMAFDIYMECREFLWKERASHLYNRTHNLLERYNLLKPTEEGK